MQRAAGCTPGFQGGGSPCPSLGLFLPSSVWSPSLVCSPRSSGWWDPGRSAWDFAVLSPGGLPKPGAAPCGPRLPGGAAASPDTLFSSPLLLQDSSPGALPTPPSLAGVLAGIVTDFHVTVCVGSPYLEGSAGCTVGGLGLDGGMCVCLSPAGAPGHSVRMLWRCQTLDPWVHRSGRWEMGGPSPGSTSWTRPISDGVAGESPIPGSAAHGGAVPARPPGVSP